MNLLSLSDLFAPASGVQRAQSVVGVCSAAQCPSADFIHNDHYGFSIEAKDLIVGLNNVLDSLIMTTCQGAYVFRILLFLG